ncbi:MAG: efflux RND transporter periplasmic adaptor subunit [Sphaerochaetaceae bacterium]|nr:efflux RND transporter periplasmic adaptor subunit [Spirochaetales bacterium]
MRESRGQDDSVQTTEMQVRSALKKKLRKRRIRRIIGYLIFILIIALGFFVYQFYKTNQRLPFTQPVQTRAAITGPTEVKVTETVYSQVIDLSGSVEAFQTQTVVFRSTGAVTQVNVKEGDRVAKGDILAKIDDTNQRYNVANIESRIEEARLTGSQRDLELYELQLLQAENSLDYTEAKANFDGLVAAVNIEEGGYFEAGTPAMIIIDRSKLKATVEIDEIDIQNVEIGMNAELTFDALSGKTIPSTVTYIPMLGRTTNQGIGVLDVELTIENPPEEIYPGFTFAGTITVPSESSMLVVPTSAVATSRNVSTVTKKGADGNPVSVTVTTKYLGEGMTQILSGDIRAGDTLLVTPTGGNSLFNMMVNSSPGGPFMGR